MSKKRFKRLLKYLLRLIVPVLVVVCLINYWCAYLIIDKIHYGIFMLAMLIIMIDNMNNNNGGKVATN